MLFSAECVESLHNVCPNCGGGFTPRPIRPATEWRPGLSVVKRPPSAKRVQVSYGTEEIVAFAAVLWLRSSVQPDMREFRLIAWLARGKDYCRRC